MKLNWLYRDEISKILDFNENNGKYEKKIGKYKVELNSWNNKLFVKEETGEETISTGERTTIDVPTELIKLIINIDTTTRIEFEELENSNDHK